MREAARLCGLLVMLTELAPAVAEAFAKDEIGLGHALLLAKIQPEQQREACRIAFRSISAATASRNASCCPARHLQQWIERNILLELASAPFPERRRRIGSRRRRLCRLPEANWLQYRSRRRYGGRGDSCTDPNWWNP